MKSSDGKFIWTFLCFFLVKVTYVDEAPPSVDATYSKGFSAKSTLNAQSSVNAGINGQSSIASTYNAQSPLGSVDSQSSIYTNVDTAPQQVYVQKFKKRLHHRHHLWPSHNKVSTTSKSLEFYHSQRKTIVQIIKTNINFVKHNLVSLRY